MPTREQLVLSAALLGAAFSSSALLSCKDDHVSAEPPAVSASAAPPLDPNDPEALRRAAAVIASWNQKDPALTAKVLKESGIVITDPATFQAMADASAAVAAASAAASASAATAASAAPAPSAVKPRKPPPPAAPML